MKDIKSKNQRVLCKDSKLVLILATQVFCKQKKKFLWRQGYVLRLRFDCFA
jgi:hypothetical protein